MYTKTPGCQIPNLVDIYLKQFGYITDGFFVEVGAFNGINWSNTRCLALAGWGGLMVEPHPEYFEKLKELYIDNPKIAYECFCIGKENGGIELYLGGSNSTTNPKMVEIYNDIEWARISGLTLDKFIQCELMTLDTLLEMYDRQPNFEVLVIDVEGAEIDVLKGFDIQKWQPQLAIVETHKHNDDKRLARKARWIDMYFCKYGYEEIYSDYINSIYVRKV